MIRAFSALLAVAALLAAVPLSAQVPEAAVGEMEAPVGEALVQEVPAPETPAEEAAAPAPEAPPAFATQQVVLATSEGSIILALEVERAPATAANFLKYVDQKRFDGTSFYRALRFPDHDDLGLLQGGTRGDPKRVLPPVVHEPTSKTGLTHDDGAISMARGAPGSADGDFFLIIGNLSSLDANPAQEGAGDKDGYAVFGHVVGGMDVVQRILAGPVSATEGEGLMKGQMLEKPVRILSARRLGN